MTEDAGFRRVGSGCGVQGCLFAAVAIFVLILVGVLIVAFFRFQEPPAGPPRPISAVGAAGPTADGRQPTAGVEGRGEPHA